MPRTRTAIAELAAQWNAATSILYVLDEGRRIVFCNPACAAWAGISVEQLQGQVCHYSTSPVEDAALAAANRLCPPPEVFSGQPARGVISRVALDGESSEREATFLPVAVDSSGAYLIVCVAEEDQSAAQLRWSALNNRGLEFTEYESLRARIRAVQQSLRGRYTVESLIGDSPAIRRIRQQVELASLGSTSVLIVGPSGSGREHIGRAIHYASPGAAGPLVPLSCSLLGADLLSSTIVATAQKFTPRTVTGIAATSGTLLLTDVDALPLEVQPELVRVMASAPAVRVISTSAKQLLGGAAPDGFHLGLAHALSTLVIEVPALKDRREDIPVLAQAFLEQQNSRGERQVRGFTSDALDRLAAYGWPENIRQLSEVVRESYETSNGYEITVADLPERIRLAGSQRPARPKEEPIVLDEFLSGIEAELIGRALKRAKGNKARAAKLLGMTRPRLYRRMVQLNMIQDSSSPEL